MLPEGEDLNEWIAVNSKSWETEIHQSVGVEWKDADLCFSSIQRSKQKMSQNEIPIPAVFCLTE